MAHGVRPFEERDYEGVAAVHNAVLPEYRTGITELRHYATRRDSKCRFQRSVYEADGRILGHGSYDQLSGMYHPHRFHMEIQVLPEERGRGHGSALYRRILEGIAPFDAWTLRAQVRADMVPGLRFLAHRGFFEEMRMWESRLEVAAFDPSAYVGLEERLAEQGIVIRTLRELEDDPERNEKLYELHCLADQDMPSPEPPTRVPLEVFLERALNNPGVLPDGYFIATQEGRYVGVSNLWKSEGSADLYTGDTGVLREYRRRGIALAMKVRAIAFATAGGSPLIKTWNESRNRPMLAINERLGFVRQPAWIHAVKILREEPERTMELRPIEPGGENGR